MEYTPARDARWVEIRARHIPSLTSFFDPFTHFRLRVFFLLTNLIFEFRDIAESCWRISRAIFFNARSPRNFRYFFDTFLFNFHFSSLLILKRKEGRFETRFLRLGFEKEYRKCRSWGDVARKWTGLECECTMRPRLRRSYRPSTARPCTRGNRETFGLGPWRCPPPVDEKSCQGLFLYNLKNRVLEHNIRHRFFFSFFLFTILFIQE